MKIVEAIPNFSEGKRGKIIDKILQKFKDSDVKLLDYTYDEFYNRLVITIMGEPREVKKTILTAAKVAVEEIDMNRHKGSHPRMGALDVVPFVPLKNMTMEECVQLSKEFAEEYSEKLEVPVFLYAESAQGERKNLDFVDCLNEEGHKVLSLTCGSNPTGGANLSLKKPP